MADNTPDFAPPLAALAVQNPVTITTTGSGIKDVQKDGTTIDLSSRSKLNLITGAGTTLTVADNSASDRVDVTVASNIYCVADSTLGGAAASIDLTGLPTTYAQLVIDLYLRGDTAATGTQCFIRFNNDSGANYDYQRGQFSAAAANALEFFAQTSGDLGSIPANTATANVFYVGSVVIPNYANSSNHKALTGTAAVKQGTASGNMTAYQLATFWRSTAAINRVTITPAAGNLAAGSRVSVYVKGAS